jgi:hypothetical protein
MMLPFRDRTDLSPMLLTCKDVMLGRFLQPSLQTYSQVRRLSRCVRGGLEPGKPVKSPGSGKSCHNADPSGQTPAYSAACSLFSPLPGCKLLGGICSGIAGCSAPGYPAAGLCRQPGSIRTKLCPDDPGRLPWPGSPRPGSASRRRPPLRLCQPLRQEAALSARDLA